MCWSAVSMAGEMTMIAYPHVVQRERFLADVTTRRATVRLPLFFWQHLHGHIGGYNIFHAMRQVLELSREPRYIVFIATELIRRLCVVVRTRSSLY